MSENHWDCDCDLDGNGLEIKQLQWFGHLKQMGESRKPRQIMEAPPEWIRTKEDQVECR